MGAPAVGRSTPDRDETRGRGPVAAAVRRSPSPPFCAVPRAFAGFVRAGPFPPFSFSSPFSFSFSLFRTRAVSPPLHARRPFCAGSGAGSGCPLRLRASFRSQDPGPGFRIQDGGQLDWIELDPARRPQGLLLPPARARLRQRALRRALLGIARPWRGRPEGSLVRLFLDSAAGCAGGRFCYVLRGPEDADNAPRGRGVSPCRRTRGERTVVFLCSGSWPHVDIVSVRWNETNREYGVRIKHIMSEVCASANDAPCVAEMLSARAGARCDDDDSVLIGFLLGAPVRVSFCVHELTCTLPIDQSVLRVLMTPSWGSGWWTNARARITDGDALTREPARTRRPTGRPYRRRRTAAIGRARSRGAPESRLRVPKHPSLPLSPAISALCIVSVQRFRHRSYSRVRDRAR